jgi:hypothetical protein
MQWETSREGGKEEKEKEEKANISRDRTCVHSVLFSVQG